MGLKVMGGSGELERLELELLWVERGVESGSGKEDFRG